MLSVVDRRFVVCDYGCLCDFKGRQKGVGVQFRDPFKLVVTARHGEHNWDGMVQAVLENEMVALFQLAF